MKKPVITVVGSINMDLFVQTDKRPAAGETVLGNDFYTSPGGKGANQAVAAARLGAEVYMIGSIGTDAFGNELKNFLAQENIHLDGVEPVLHLPSGVALITLADNDNSIIVNQGANLDTTKAQVKKYEDIIAKSDVVLTQLEIPLEAVAETINLCVKHQTKIILNPAPIAKLPEDILEKTSYLTPNELEYEALTKQADLQPFLEKLIITQGKAGVDYMENGKKQTIASHQVTAVDTTGAGDTFNGALAYALAEGNSISAACEFANAAAALSVQKLGAQAGMPTKEEVLQLIQ